MQTVEEFTAERERAGRLAYEAYSDHTGGKSLATGDPLPEVGRASSGDPGSLARQRGEGTPGPNGGILPAAR